MACWQTIAYWQGVASGIVLSFLFWFCLDFTYRRGKEAATEKPEAEE